MATSDQEIVELVIDAKNLTSDELNQAAEDVEELGAKSKETARQLDKLEINKTTLQSYKELDEEIDRLTKEIVESQVAHKNLREEVKKNKDATDEQRKAVVQQNENTKRLRKELTSVQSEYNKVGNSLRKVNVDTKNLELAESRLNSEIVRSRKELKNSNAQLESRANSLRKAVAVEKQNVAQLAESSKKEQELERSVKERLRSAKEANDLKRREVEETRRVEKAVEEYEKELTKLNAAYKSSLVSAGDFIRREAKLRKELNLTEKQITTSRKAVEADAKSKSNAVKSTDALTKVTRRLAQAYTVLVAAQSAAAAVGDSVRGYGELEAAITKVEKTTGNAREEVIAMADELSRMSKDVTPTSTTELLRFAEVAGQLGTKNTEDILNLASAADTLQVSTNLAGDEAAILLARILGMTNQGIPSIQNLSSTVVDLGNNMKVAEDEIVRMTKEIVTGTREIGLSAQASAALGATLAETGQQAERSRTAFFKLSNSIREAVTSGGEDLESLIAITGQTADELERNLGERPEAIILDFVKGLASIREEGQTLSGVLKNFGIEGTEAGAVFSALTENVDVLEGALKRADEAFVDGTKHIEEAAKAYADQDAAIARTINNFNSLKKAIGEAYSDETDAAIRKTNELINNNGDAIVRVMEYIPQLVDGISEGLSALDEFFDAFGNSADNIEQTFNALKLGFNSITLGIRAITQGLQEFAVISAETYNAITPFQDFKISTEWIDNLKNKISETKESAKTDMQDIRNAIARMSGESSESFEDLVNTISKYGDAVNKLSDSQRQQISDIIEVQGYQKDQEGVYRDLTAAIVRKNRELEAEASFTKEAKQTSEDLETALLNQSSALDKSADSAKTFWKTIDEGNKLSAEQLSNIQELTQAREEGRISEALYVDLVIKTTKNVVKFSEAVKQATESRKQESITTEDLLQKTNDLYSQYEQGLIAVQELEKQQKLLLSTYESTAVIVPAATEATRNQSERQKELAVQIANSERELKKYQRELDNSTLGDTKRSEILAKQSAEMEKLNNLRQQSTDLIEIESATYRELQTLYERYNEKLENVERSFRQGIITYAEYIEQSNRLKALISELTSVIDVNTKALNENTEASIVNQRIKEKQAEKAAELAQFASLELEAYQYLTKEFNFNSKSADELRARYDELADSISNNMLVTNQWWVELAKVSNEGFRREQQIIDETLAMRKWQEQVESGTLSLSDLSKMADRADFYFKNLSEQQLSGLRDAIKQARSEFEALDQAINNSLDNVQDRLDRIQGNEEAIVKRQYEKELEELFRLREQAIVTDDQSLLNKINDAIRKLKQAQELEYKSMFNERSSNRNLSGRPQAQTVDTGPGPQTQTLGTYDVNVTMGGRAATITTADRQSAENLLNIISEMGGINTGGAA